MGLFVRFLIYIKFGINRRYARLRGATIGKNVLINFKLAKKANHNLIIDDDVICETSYLDLRSPIHIHNNCIINNDVVFIRASHYVDDNTKFTTRYYPILEIESYSWLCTGCHILPNVTKISRGTIVSAFSTLVRNTEEMDVIGKDGNPIRKHNAVFSDLVVPSLQGGDFLYYKEARHS